MSGDFTRDTFRPEKAYSAVRMQQGRVSLDSDFNEQVDIGRDALRRTAASVIGLTGFPEDNAGFAILPSPAGGYILTPGEAYVDGIRVVLPPPATIKLKRIAGVGALTDWQVVNGARVAVGDQLLVQPLVPGPVAQASLVTELRPDAGGRQVLRCTILTADPEIDVFLYRSPESQPFMAGPRYPPDGVQVVYLDVWDRSIGALEDPLIREVALGGPDTAIRDQIVWQIKYARYSDLIEARTWPEASCESFGPGWTPFGKNKPRGAMAARAEAGSAASDPCVLPWKGGYRNLVNRLYRVEIHNGGDAASGGVRCKWSRDNSIHCSGYDLDGNALVVDSVGRDQETMFKVNDWLEILDEARQLDGRPGYFGQISDVNDRRVTLGQLLDPDTLQPLPASGPPNMNLLPVRGVVRRWEGGTPAPVVPNSWVKLENGVEIFFAPGFYESQDFWNVPARTITADIEWPRDPVTGEPALLPRKGVIHHYCVLALMKPGPQGPVPTDCRSLFAPLTRQRDFHYLGGGGQEATPDPLNPGKRIRLQADLWCGVVRGRTPVKDASVRFTVVKGTGLLHDSFQVPTLTVPTNSDGIASVYWWVDAVNPHQQVLAELLDSAGRRTHNPILFSAQLSTAAETSFDPAHVPELAGANTVQEAIEKLAEMQCGCTICVSAKAHNSGELTIQAALAKLPPAGGTVCLGPGDFALGVDPVIIMNRESIRLRGHGIATQLAYSGAGGAIRVEAALDVRISDLAILVASAGPAAPAVGRASAVQIANSNRIGVTRTRLQLQSDTESADLGVALDGFLIDVSIEDNEIDAPIAIGALAGQDEPGGGSRLCLLYELRIADNLLSARRYGIALQGYVLHMGAVHIDENVIRSQGTGIIATGASLKAGDETMGESIVQSSGASLWIGHNTISFRDDGIVSGIHDLRVLDNHIGAMTPVSSVTGGSCIRLAEGIYPAWKPDGQIVGNTLGRADRFALAIETPQARLIVKNNLIRNCAAGAVAATAAARIESLSFDNNNIEQVGTRRVGDIVAGVSLALVDNAQIAGNSLRGVGQGSSGAIYWAGFAIAGAPSLDLSNNFIADIGPEGPANAAVGVLVEGAILNCSITSNSIISDLGPTQMPMSWCGIFVGGGLKSALSGGPHGTNIGGIGINMATAAMFADLDNLAMRIDATGATPAAAAATGPAPVSVREPQISISLNKITAAHPASKLPLVRVTSDTNLSSCIFTGNQCTLRGAGSVASIVDLRASRLVVANNVVRRLSNATAITLTCRIVSQKPDAAILGNITFGGILVNNQPVPAPFVPLNLLSA